MAAAAEVGVALAAAGVAWAAWAAWLLLASGGRRLVDDGPYRFGRHPLYLGVAALLAGLVLAAGVPLLVLAVAGVVVAVDRLMIPREEAALQRAYGGWYSDYRASVPRWL